VLHNIIPHGRAKSTDDLVDQSLHNLEADTARRFEAAVAEKIRILRRLVAIGKDKQLFDEAVYAVALTKLFTGDIP
jgi:hypothetical protein